MAGSFVRVRLTRIEEYDLNLFEFDYDLTMMIFFLDPTGKKVYARYGQRNAVNADALQSLDGLAHTMKSVLAMHASAEPKFAPRSSEQPRFVHDIQGAKGRGCFHCHNVRESLNRELKINGQWTSDKAWHFPLPDNIGLTMEVNRGNVVAKVKPKTAAEKAGLQQGDQLTFAGNVPIHSIADLQYALEHLPAKTELKLRWLREGQTENAELALSDGWRRGDIRWRHSMHGLVPNLYLGGANLTADERAKLGLSATQVAFRLNTPVGTRAKAAGFEPGDIILGVEGQWLDNMDDNRFFYWLQSQYLAGDTVRFTIVRQGKRTTQSVVIR
ncbi:MAG: PDZ domain-containing protein [Planctomycetes bacterium]|nr:PDZ domain-containing protein [Planctomycetota bacterium]